jgi:hypothetical protein
MPWREYNHSGLLTNRSLGLELGAVVSDDEVEVVEPSLGQCLNRLQNLDRAGGAGQLGPVADSQEIQSQRIEGLDQRLAGDVDREGCRPARCVGPDHVGGGLGLRADLLKPRGLVLGCAPAVDREIREAEVR